MHTQHSAAQQHALTNQKVAEHQLIRKVYFEDNTPLSETTREKVVTDNNSLPHVRRSTIIPRHDQPTT